MSHYTPLSRYTQHIATPLRPYVMRMSEREATRPERAGRSAWRQSEVVARWLVDALVPWLLDLGTWIFGALIAFDLVMLGAAVTVGGVDTAMIIGAAAFAVALPPAVLGLFVMRLVSDMSKIRGDEAAVQAARESGVPPMSESERKAAERRLHTVTLSYAYGSMAVAAALALVGLTAALWHVAWWVAVAFVAMLLATLIVMVLALVSIGGGRPRSDG